MGTNRVHDRPSQITRRQAVVVATARCAAVFFFFPSTLFFLISPLSLLDTVSLFTMPLAISLFPFLHSNSSPNAPFYFIFFTFYTPTTSIHHHFLIFHPHSPNFTNQNPNPYFSLSKNRATLRCFSAISSSDSTSPPLKLHFAPPFATTSHDFCSLHNPPPMKVQSLSKLIAWR